MTFVSNDPSWLPLINYNILFSYFAVASSVAVIYDWALTLSQEFELVWRQHWSLMSVLYFGVRYIGVLFSAITILWSLPTVSVTDVGCTILNIISSCVNFIVVTMLGVIIITRLHAMYQASRKMLIFLVVIFSAVTIASGIIIGITSSRVSGEELVLYGINQCAYDFGSSESLIADTWIILTAWEILTMFLSAWIVIQHFRELRRSSTGSTLGDCFTVLIKTHVFYFAAYAAVACFDLGSLSPNVSNSTSLGINIYDGAFQISLFMQLFVLGPRLILSVREFNAKLVADSDEGTAMTTIAFGEHVHDVSVASGV